MQDNTASFALTLCQELSQGFQLRALQANTAHVLSEQLLRFSSPKLAARGLARMALSVVRQEPEALGVLRQHLEAHRMLAAPCTAAQEAHDRLGDGQLLAFARACAGVPFCHDIGD